MRTNSRRFLVSLALCSAGFVGCASEEPATGTVTGKVTYASKPVTAGIVVYENPSLALINVAELDSEGRYRLPDIRVANYTVSVQPPDPTLPSESDGTMEEIKAKMAIVKIPDPKNIPRPVRSTQIQSP